jgi:hypothetical protein
MNVYTNQEAKETIVSFFDNAKESISNISIKSISDYLEYSVEICNHFKTDKLSRCAIENVGSHSWLITSCSSSHDEIRIEDSKMVSLTINIKINRPPLNNYENEIERYLIDLKASHIKQSIS